MVQFLRGKLESLTVRAISYAQVDRSANNFLPRWVAKNVLRVFIVVCFCLCCWCCCVVCCSQILSLRFIFLKEAEEEEIKRRRRRKKKRIFIIREEEINIYDFVDLMRLQALQNGILPETNCLPWNQRIKDALQELHVEFVTFSIQETLPTQQKNQFRLRRIALEEENCSRRIYAFRFLHRFFLPKGKIRGGGREGLTKGVKSEI